MKSQVWVYIVVVLLSIGAGVAIAGIPEPSPEEPTFPPPSTTVATAADTPAPTTEPVGTEPPETTTTASSTTAPTTTSTTTTTTTTTAATTTTNVTTTTTVLLPARDEISVDVANGANVGGSATRVSNNIEELGYRNVGSFDGDEIVDVTVIYAIEGFQGAAERLAEEVGLEPDLIFPFEAAPDVPALGVSTQLLLYLGRDVESLAIYG